MTIIGKHFAVLLASGIVFASSLPAQSQSLDATGNVSIGGDTGANVDVDASIGDGGADANVDASIGGDGGADANVDASIGDGGADANVDASIGGDGGANGNVDVSIGGDDGANGNVDVSIGGDNGTNGSASVSTGGNGANGSASVSTGGGSALGGSVGSSVGSVGTGSAAAAVGGGAARGKPGQVIDQTRTTSIKPGQTTTSRSKANALVAGMSQAELARFKKRCAGILGDASGFDAELVALCQAISAAR